MAISNHSSDANPILVIGGANVDLSGRSSAAFIAADSNPGEILQSAGGVARNIAENLSRLGRKVSLISIIGDDAKGRFLAQHSRAVGIDCSHLITHPSGSTSCYLSLQNEQGQLIGAIADMDLIDQLTPALLQSKLAALKSAAVLVVEANLPAATLAWLAQQKLPAQLVADAVSATKAPRLAPLLPALDLLKLNRAEALALLNKSANTACSDRELIDSLLELGVRTILLSMGEQGVLWASEAQIYRRAAPKVSLVGDNGAGDALLAGYLHSARLSTAIKHRLGFALGCAAVTLECAEAVAPRLNEAKIYQRFGNL